MTHKQAKAAVKKMGRKELLAFLAWLMAWLETERNMNLPAGTFHSISKQSKKTKKEKKRKRKRASPAQAKARRRFAAFIKKHGRPPHKGEHL